MFHIHDYLHGPISHYFKNKEMDELYVSIGIKALAQSIIQIFIPIYLYKLGFSISTIALYYIIFFTSITFFMYFSMRLNYHLGLKKVLSLGTFVLIGYYFLLDQLSRGNIHYSIVAITLGLSMAIYYSSFHIYFTKFSDKKHEASEISIIRALFRFAAIIGPLIGAFLITKGSFRASFLIVSGLLFISIFPLFLTKDKKINNPKISINRILKADSKKKGLAYIASGIIGVTAGILWPLFIFLNIKKVITLGFIISIGSLITIFFLFMIGKIADKHKRKMLEVGIYSHSITWPIRLFFLTPVGIFIMNMLSSITLLMIDLPFSKITYEKGRKSKNIANYFLFREMNLQIGRITVLLIAFFTGSIYWTFILSFFATFLYLVLLKDKKDFPLLSLLP
jgi:MFS family permease